MDNLQTYLSILGKLFYAPQEERISTWKSLGEGQQQAFLEQLSKAGFYGFLVNQLGSDNLPESVVNENRHRIQAILVQSMRNQIPLKQLYRQLEVAGIRHIPIKGIDLSTRIYPSPSLRPVGDWDVFFHPEDIDRARQLLMADGWKEYKAQERDVNHHYAPLVKKNLMLEPHWTLSCCQAGNPLDIWELSVPVEGNPCRRHLSPELNLMLAARHASEKQYRMLNITKVLLDSAYIIDKEGVDWDRLREICRKLNQPYSGNFFGAFPEFFPGEMIAAMKASKEQAQATRSIIGQYRSFLNTPDAAFMMQSSQRFSRIWFLQVFHVLRPKNMRHKYSLPAKGAGGRLCQAYCRETWNKTIKLFRCILFRNQPLNDYCRLIQLAEKQD